MKTKIPHFIFAGLFAVTTASQGASIAITNFSFQADDQGGDGGLSVATPTGWTNLGGILGTINFNAGARYTTADADDANPSGGTIGDMDGNQALFTINNGGVSQTLGDSIVVGNLYTMTVAIGDHDAGNRAGFSGYDIRLLAGGSTVASISSTTTPGDGTFTDVSFSYTAQAGDSGLLGIELIEINGGSGKAVDFDNVRLSFTSFVPEPSSTALLGLGCLAIALRRKRS